VIESLPAWLFQVAASGGKFLITLITAERFWSTLIGAFAGAFLAFWFGLHRDKITRRNEHKAAGNVAMATIARQLSEFIQLKQKLYAHREDVIKRFPAAPLWFQVLPLQRHFSQSPTYDLKALVFLFEQKAAGAQAAEQLITAEMCYFNLVHLLNAHTVVAESVQAKLATSRLDPYAETPVIELERAVGFASVAQMNSLVSGIFEHLERDEAMYTAAAQNLHDLLVKTFSTKGVLNVTVPGNKEGATPGVP
jgi:hypothetical protein